MIFIYDDCTLTEKPDFATKIPVVLLYYMLVVEFSPKSKIRVRSVPTRAFGIFNIFKVNVKLFAFGYFSIESTEKEKFVGEICMHY